MERLLVEFPVSGVTTYPFVPPLVAFLISALTSTGGLSGAFLLLPFQMSVLGYTAPSVTGTNHLFNVVAIPSGVYRYMKEGRMAWPLAWVVVAGTLPGVFLGYYLRVRYFLDPSAFKLFVGLVLLYIGVRLLTEFRGRKRPDPLDEKFKNACEGLKKEGRQIRAGLPPDARVKTISFTLKKVTYEFWCERFSFSTPGMFTLSLAVGVIGGAYGIGGGAIIAPFCVSVFRLPVYTIAGAALMGTFLTSAAATVFFSLGLASGGVQAMPDWPLGLLFGLGGFFGIYAGARMQKYLPQKAIKIILGVLILFVAVNYIVQFFS